MLGGLVGDANFVGISAQFHGLILPQAGINKTQTRLAFTIRSRGERAQEFFTEYGW